MCKNWKSEDPPEPFNLQGSQDQTILEDIWQSLPYFVCQNSAVHMYPALALPPLHIGKIGINKSRRRAKMEMLIAKSVTTVTC